MQERSCVWRIAISLVFASVGVACDAGVPPEVDSGRLVDGGRANDATVPTDGGGDAGVERDGGTSCASLDCDDGVACTDDGCVAGLCSHDPRNDRCPPGALCDARIGCTGGEVCLSDDECPPSPGGCFGPSRCDMRTRTCTYPPLDGDLDGYAPPVCGGMDCNDADPTIHPGAPDSCDGIDNDCDGDVDSPLSSGSCRTDQVCVSGACGCAAGWSDCSGTCRDPMSDTLACGDCSTSCALGESCVAGSCECPSPRIRCGSVCADLTSDRANCGACGRVCGSDAFCASSDCACPSGLAPCGPSNACVSLSTTLNCGACGSRCLTGASCESTGCSPAAAWARAYVGTAYAASASNPHFVRFASDGGVVTAGEIAQRYVDPGTSATVLATGYGYAMAHDASGALRWSSSIVRTSASGSLSVEEMLLGADDSVYVLLRGTGLYAFSSGGTTASAFGLFGVGVAKLSPAGVFEWFRGGTGFSSSGQTLVVDASRVAIVGWASASVTFEGSTYDTSSGTRYGYVSVYGLDGTHQVAFRTPGRPEAAALSGAELRLIGTFAGTADFDGTVLTSVGASLDLFVARYSLAGAALAAVAFGTADSDDLYAVTFLDGGDLVLSWHGASLMRMTASGAIVWYQLGGMPATRIGHDAADRLLITRWSSTSGTGYLARHRSDGALDWEISFVGHPSDAVARGSRLAMAGGFRPRFTLGAFTSGVSSNPGLFTAVLEAP